MGLVSHGLAVGIGYLLGQPAGREKLRQVGQQAADLSRRPEVARLREQGKSVATEKVDAVKQKVAAVTSAKETDGTGTTPAGTAEPGDRPRRRLALPTERLRRGRSRTAHFPPSPGTPPPASLGGTTVVEDSEAVVRGRHAAARADASPTTADGS